VTLGTSFHRYIRSFAVPFLSRLAPSRGLVALRQTLVRRCHGGLGSSQSHRKSANQNMTAVRRSLANRRLSRPSPCAGLLLCAKHLFVSAMVAGVHPGLPPIGKSGDRGVAAQPGLRRRSLANRDLTPAGLVALHQTFVRRCHGGGVHPANQNMNQRGGPRSRPEVFKDRQYFLDVLNSPATFSDERTLQSPMKPAGRST
jgi:hypothetical protein